MSGRTIAVGDIHGCAAALDAILECIDLQPADCFVTLGDYVDRGPDSRRVIETLLSLVDSCQRVSLLGNHELMMLAARNDSSYLPFWLSCGGQETLDSYGGSLSQIPDSHWQFIESCRAFHETESHLFVHANYLPDRHASEFTEADLFWRHLGDYPPAPHSSGKTVVLGHTPQPGQIRDMGHVICIDTFCFGTGRLTALDVNTGDVWQADKQGRLWVLPTS